MNLNNKFRLDYGYEKLKIDKLLINYKRTIRYNKTV